MTTLTLIRGLPGSGKSTLAQQLVLDSDDFAVHYEADMFFMDNGKYNWDANKVGAAHAWCQRETKDALQMEYNVVVSNTFTTYTELKPYFKIARLFNIIPQVIICQNQFGNVHNVPELTLDKMRNRFQYDISQLYEEFK